MTDGVVLRRALPADARAVADVWLRSFATALPTVGRAHSDDEVRAYFREVVVPLHETWVAETADGNEEGDGNARADGNEGSDGNARADGNEGGDGVVGMMVLHDDELSQLYVAPAWRGRGLGDRFVALAKERSPRGLTLWTFQVNAPAHRFYERHGFVAAEYTDGSDNEEREPDVRYVWRP
ncbi:GNAT family N-acetyltransferase [Streptomyces sp. NPDC014636]|uniref:GNAT family N-acetyltransferase n=1 Tax=Streptomyces sp. NPDC014636 TaxID=3364876 RepID=UPI0036FFD1C5